MTPLDPVTPQTISAALERAMGLAILPDRIALEWRDWRWMAHLPRDLIAWIPIDPSGAEQLGREGKLLRLLESRVSFGLPSMKHCEPRIQVRRRIPGIQVGGDGRERAFAALPQGARLADDLGRALGSLHSAVTPAETSSLRLTQRGILPGARALRDRLDGKLLDQTIEDVFVRLLALYDQLEIPDDDIALIHGDLWGGNLAVDAESGALNGIFDFDNAGIGDRHLDLMYVHSFGEVFRERVFAAYAATSGFELSVQRTALYHAISAVAALADAHDKGEGIAECTRWVADVCHGPVGRLALGPA
jgi:aminoglycoside phosphotransferase (APT) family kinase protein